MSNNKKVYIKTYGCQMNIYDSERISEMLSSIGFESSDTIPESDVVILNTCHIREKASEKVYSELGRIKKEKDKAKEEGRKMLIVVAGCVAQAEGQEIIKRSPWVDIVTGPESYHHLPDLISSAIRDTKSYSQLDFTPDEKFDKLPSKRSKDAKSGFITIQEGCDKFCSFCVVPYTRGPEFSRPTNDIIEEAKQLADLGLLEITLLGQNVNAYHGLNSQKAEEDIAHLISEIGKIDSIKRIRYATSHPVNMTQSLIEEHWNNPKLMPFLHLPVQSGSNKVLRAMNRKHTKQDYITIIEKLRENRSGISFSSDFIVASPEETEEDFQDTLDLIDEVQFAQSYSFKYSPRPGTPSALKTQIAPDIANERLWTLQEKLDKQHKKYNATFQDKELDILVDNFGKRKEYNQVSGKTEYMQTVSVNIPEGQSYDHLLGTIARVKITDIKQNTLVGTLVK